MGLFPDMEDLYTLTPMQEGMLFHALYDATSYSYFEQTSYRLQGKLDIGLVEKSLNELLKRHDILRTAFVYKDIQRPVQVVLKDKVIDLYYQDISHMGEMEVKENIIKEFKEKDKNRSFDLSKDVLMRVSILQVDKSDYQFTWSFHHILMDGWCIGILNNEFFEIYTSYIENRPYRLPVVKPYRTYIQWLEKQDKEISARYWQNYLHSFEEPTVVPKTSIINKRENDAGYRNETVSLVLNREKITKLNKLAARNHVTLNTVTQTIWGIILGKYNRKEDVVFGTVVSGRPFELEGVESMLGLFINTIPVRIRFEEQVKFNRLLGKIQEAAVASEPHHYHPLAEIQSRSPLKQNLIDHLFIFENYPIAEQIEGYGSERHKSEKLALKLVKVDVFEQTNYDFNVIISASNQGRIIFQYNGNVYERDFVERIGDHLRVTMDQVIENEGIEIKEIGLLSDEENHRILYEFNNTTTAYPQEKTISQLFAEQVEIVPDNVALIGQSAKRKEERQAQCAMLHAITYKELNEQTHQLAHILQSKGVGPDTIAAVMVERSIEMIIGILAILKAGGAYLPIAPDYPEDRIRFMLADSASKILVTTKDLSKEIKFEKEIIYLSEAINLASTPSTLQLSPAPATCLAYVIYTSGTTGGPKGVMIENKSVNRLVKNSNYIDYMGLTREDRFLLTGEFTFDISTFEIWGLLLNGLNIYISDKNMILNVERFQEVVVKNKISVIHFIPQLFLQISASCPEIFAKIRFLMVGGDVVRPESINRLRDKYQQLKILHMYGPTENTTFSTFFPIDKNYEERLPIGKPVSNSTVYITDNYNRPQPIGVVGELCVGGDGIARGYLNRPQLTAQKFVLVDGSWLTAERAVKEETADFPMSYQLSTISYIYKTGDLARWLADGNIEFFGRIDLQVKIRGFRIEVGEIETQLVNHTDIKEAVVHSKTEKNGERYLIAYIISHRDIPVSELREYLLKYLPDYMIPSYFIRLDTIPLTPTGKIDRKALPGPELKVDEGYIAPAGIIEKKLVEIWEKVLGIGKDIIGIDENFFQLGGHSLKATLLISGIYKTFHVNIPLKTIFSTPTIRGLSAYIKESAQDYYVSITPVEKKEYYALSSPQKRLYVLQQMDEQGIGYNIPSVSTWEGEIHKDRLEKSIMKLLRRHESLRTSFHMVNEEPVQMIHQAVEFEIEYYDLYRTQDEMKVKVEESEGTGELAPLSKDPATRNPQPATALISSFIRPFDLSRVPLMRVGLIKETEHKYILMVDMHHIISDGTSMNILIKDFTDLYSGKDLPQLKIQFKDFSEWRISSQQAALIKQQESFWLKEFEGEIPILNLPSDYIRPAFKSVEGSLVSSEITEYETRVLKKYAFQEGATLFMVLLAIFDVLLYKLSGQEDIVIGFPIAGRRHWDLESVIGMLVNTLALRNFPLGDKAFKQFLKEIRERTVIAFDNQEYPLEELVEKVADDRDASRNPLFDVMLVMQNFTMSPAQEANSHGIAPQQPVHIANEDEHIFQTSKFDLTLTAVERREGLGISLQYCTKLFKKETAERLITYFKKIVSIVVKEQGIRLHDIEVISKEEQRQILYQFNNTEAHYPRGKTLHGLFAEQAERMPGYIIAVGPSLVTIDQLPMQISYRELHHRANHIAALLRARNVKPGTIVGIMVEPCLEMVVAIVGVLKAGGVFLPLEPESPMERVNFVLNDSNAGLVLTRPRLAEGFKGKIQVINIEESNRYTQYTGQGKNFERGTGPAHPAYVIYTSGTLGRPKGVLISHKNLVNYVYWFAQTIRLSANDKAILTSSFAFDAIYTQFFSSLVTGCELHVIPRETFLLPERLINYLRDHEITYVKMTPSLFNLVVNSPWFSQKMLRGLRFVMLGGEEINVKDVETAHKVCPHFRMMNHYGPTETTIGSIARFIDLDKLEEYKLTPTIGKPLDNTQAYILDKGFNAVPMGVVGGLFIGGDGVGIGYVNKPELTWEKFRIGLLGRNTSIYCTGDLARWKGEGNIEFLGRADDQVKIRGYRVEPGEIESRLLTHPEIREAVLLVREEEMGDKYLCAYIVSARELDMVELREWLSRELPDYMIPSYFVQLEKIPLTPHAKIDRRALPKPELKTQPGYVAPRSGVEERLAGLWSEVLGIERDVISRNSNFFHLGGQSLKVTTLATKIHKELNIKIPLTEFFKTPTIQGLSAYITSTETESYESIEAVEKKEYYALSSAQKRLYILQRMDRDNIAYNMPGIIPLPQDADKEKLHEVFTKMIHRHESLRTSFHLIGDQPVQKIHADVEFKVEYYDLPVTGTGNGYRWEEAPVGQISNASGSQYPKGQELSAMSHIHSFIRPFDLSQAPLLRVGLTKFINHQHILMLDMNHIISDGVSMEILAKDIMSFYEGKSLPRLRIQYKDFARWHNKEKENLGQQEKYWLREFEKEIPVLNLPIDYPRPKLQSFAGNTISFNIGKEETEKLMTLVLAEEATMFMVLLAIFNVLLSKLSGQEDIVVGTGIEGRRHEDLRPIVGMFVNTLALRNFPQPNISFKEFLKQLKKSSIQGFDNQEYQFEELVDKLEVRRDSSRNPLFDVMFQFNNTEIPALDLEKPEANIYAFERRVSKFDLTLWANEGAGELLFTCEYCTKLFKRETIELFIKYFQEITSSVLANPAKKLIETEVISIQRKREILFQLKEKLEKEVEVIEKKANILQERLGKNLDKYKHNTAIECGNNVLTYSQMEERSNHAAHWIINKGIKKETAIGVLMENRPELILIMMGILKAGCVFVPLDSSYPRTRLTTMIAATGIEFVIGDTVNFNKLADAPIAGNQPTEFIFVNHLISDVKPSWWENKTRIRCGGEDRIYIYFTSGTTGKPRAILGKNKSLLHFIDWEIDTFSLGKKSRVSQVTNPGFDAFLRDVLVPLCSGGTICIPGSKETSMDSHELINWVEKSRITLIHCVPGLFRLLNSHRLTRENFKFLKFILLSGERIDPSDLANWYQIFAHRIQLVNLWGTSETTLAKTCYFIQPEDINRVRVPVGKPIPGAKVLILDEGMNLCGELITGELYIQTPYRSSGYYNDVESNRERFIPDPLSHGEDAVLHRTGDLGRWLADGNIDLIGRNDRQVKLRGIRVELAEIESILIRHPAVEEAVVIKKEITKNSELLCGYIVGRTTRDLPDEDQGEKAVESRFIQIREYLSERLPHYMVPEKFLPVETIPRTPNGKIDYNALPDPLSQEKLAGLIQPLRDRVEEKLLVLWTDILGITTININSNFFELGGNSLNIMTLISRIHREFGVRIPLGDFFNNPFLEKQASLIKEARTERYASIEAVEKREYYPLSPAQKRLYVLQQLVKNNTSYNMPYVIPLEGGVEKEKLESVFKGLIERHESLRTSFIIVNEEPVQRIWWETDFSLGFYEIRAEAEAAALVSGYTRPFDLGKAPLLRVNLVTVGLSRRFLFLDMHHIITDGTSQTILEKEFLALYGGKELSSLRLQYKDYSEWYNSAAQKEMIKQQQAYWLKEFGDELPVLHLPTDYPRPVLQGVEGNMVSFRLNAEETGIVKAMVKENDVTLYMFLLAVFNVLLSKLSGQEDIIIGTPIAARRHVDLQLVIGMLVNTLAMRNYPVGGKAFRKFLKEIKQRTLESYENQEYPFEELVDQITINRDTSRNPVFDVMFNLLNQGEYKESRYPMTESDSFRHLKGTSKFDLSLVAMDPGDRVHLNLEYSTKLFTPVSIEKIIGYFKNILKVLSGDRELKLAEIEIMGEEEKKEILRMSCGVEGAYEPGKTIDMLFSDQVQISPDGIAVIGSSAGSNQEFPLQITYRELNEKSAALAGELREKGVRPETIVSIMVDRSLELIMGIVAILKAGGAYLPISPGYPQDRIRYMLADSDVKCLLTTPGLSEEFEKLSIVNCQLLMINEKPPDRRRLNSPPKETIPHLHLSPAPVTSLAYIIYTSGSTGKPKGVVVNHSSLVNLVLNQRTYFRIDTTDRILQFSSICFDASVEQIFIALTSGASLILVVKDILLDIDQFETYISRHLITHLHAVPSFLTQLKLKSMSSLKRMVSGGEICPLELMNTWSRHCDFYNKYGPTETTITSLELRVKELVDNTLRALPIGIPIGNTTVYLFDQWLRPVPLGVTGELYIGGRGVARGYLNRPELTAEKFCLQRPGGTLFEKTAPPGPPRKNFILKGTGKNHPLPHSPIYRTGDLSRWLPDGNIQFLGRIDQQVKIRGFRIELGEIENRLSNHPGIKEAVVAAQEEENGDKYLCAYIVSTKEYVLPELGEYLGKELPDYMIPAYFVPLEKIPLTPNGKIDRKALPKPELRGGAGYTGPRNSLERKLVELWSEALNIEQDVISIDRSFFQLGGHSLRAMILVSKIHKEFDVRVPLIEIFKTPTIRGLASYIKECAKEKYTGIEPVEKKEYYALSSAQKRLYILNRIEPGKIAYNMPQFIPLPPSFNIKHMEKTFIKVIQRHESLRTSFHMISDEPVQRIHEAVDFQIEYFDLKNPRQEINVKEMIRHFVRPFDLSAAPLLHVGVLTNQDGNRILLADMHHIISDGISHEILVSDFIRLYQDQELPPLRLTYKDYSQWQNSLAQTNALKQQEAYWLSEFKGEITLLDMPLDYERTGDMHFEGSSIYFEINETLTSKVKECAGQFNVTLMMFLFSVYNILLAAYAGKEEIIVGTVIAGRRHADLQNIIGFFVNMLAIKTSPGKDKAFSDYLQEVKEKALKAFDNQEYQFEELVSKLGIQREPGRHPFVDVVFVFQDGDKRPGQTERSSLHESTLNPRQISHFDLMLHATDRGDSIPIVIEYSTALFKRATIEEFSKVYREILEQVLENQDTRLVDIKISHDLLVAKSDFIREDTEAWDL
jgi:tyrocidine synthetase-3